MSSSIYRTSLQKLSMSVILLAIALAVGVIVSKTVFPLEQTSQQSNAGSSRFVGKQAIDFTLLALDGTEASLSQFRGQPVLINFWASWCLPCREEMPELVRSYEIHKAEGLMVLGVNLTYSDSVPDAQAFADEFNITFPVLLDKDGMVAERLYQIPGVPTSFFINRDGTIERIQVGVVNATEKEKVEMNTTTTTNQRLVTILLVLLIVFVVLLIIGIVAGWLWMGGGMTLAPGASAGVGGMMGMNGQMMNNMMSACTEMMRNFQNP